MKFVRAELHNHSTHSDGAMTIEQLTQYGAQQGFTVLALTDHNTVSGHMPAQAYICKAGLPLCLLQGVEVTTFYGHILALGLSRMVDFTRLNPKQPEQFLQTLRDAGALAVGIAHPFCIGAPIMQGCRLDMPLTAMETVDYIEVVNTAAGDVFSGNQQAMDWWQSLVLRGRRIAAVSGKDTHQKPEDTPVFTTYAMVKNTAQTMPEAVIGAILTQSTLLSKGPLFWAEQQAGTLTLHFDNSSTYLGWNKRWQDCNPLLTLTDSTGRVQRMEVDLGKSCSLQLSAGATSAVVKLYEEGYDFAQLLALGAPIYCKGEENI